MTEREPEAGRLELPRSGLVAVGVLVALSAVAARAGLSEVLAIAWVAFFAMAGAVPLGARVAGGESLAGMVWGYGLASGAMVTGALVFVVPPAIRHDPQLGGFGVALGMLTGFGAHTVGHRLTHGLDVGHTTLELTAHALAAGAIIGVVYGNMPALGPVLGLAIVSHKGPAGYAAARRLVEGGRTPWVLLVPASGVGVAAIPAALLSLPASPAASAVVFGFAGGVFLHVAMDFLPECELGGQVARLAGFDEEAHHLLDRLRLHAVASTGLGGLAVFAAWLVVS